MGAVFPQVNTLPDAKVALAIAQRYGQGALCQNRADVRSHVVRAFIIVPVQAIAVLDQSCHERIEVLLHRSVRVFTEDQGSAGMLDKQVADAGSYA